MDWIKRNLFFVIGSVVALALLGGAGFYNFTRWQANAAALEELNGQFAELKRLTELKPHPGNAKQDNIKAAEEQEAEVRRALGKLGKYFERIPAIPDSTNVTSEQFAADLRRTVDALQREATNASVVLPPRYGFSFEAQRSLMVFAAGSLGPLSVQLGEVKAICDILHGAKINSLDAIRRERVSNDDLAGPATDYTERHSQTNDLAIITPYEVTFRCFTPELAAALSGFANSHYPLLVRAVTVEPAPSVLAPLSPDAAAAAPVVQYTAPVAQPAFPRLRGGEEAEGAPVLNRPVYTRPVVAAPGVAKPAALQPLVDEKQIRVSLVIYAVKLLPKK